MLKLGMGAVVKAFLTVFASFVLLVALPTFTYAKPTAEEVAEKAFGQAFIGLQKGTATISMLLEGKGRRDEGKIQILSFKSMRNSEGLLRYLVRFEKPLNKKGMAFLVREKSGAFPETWFYAAKSLTQMAAGKATGTFFGSDLIFADLLPYPKDKKGEVTLSSLEDKKIGSDDCFVVQVSIKTPESPYGKIVAYVKKDKMLPAQVEFYGQDMKLAKTLAVTKVDEIAGKSVPVQLEITKADSDRKTTLTISEINQDAKLSEEQFDPGKLFLN